MILRFSRRSRSSSLLNAVGCVLALALGACGGDGPTESIPKPIASIEVTPGADTMTALGATVEFQAVAKDADGKTISGVTFSWSSSDELVVTVSQQGMAEAVANGAAQIRASAEEVTGTAQLTVNQANDHLAFRTEPTSATAGETIDPMVEVEVVDAGGSVVEDAAIAVTLSIGTNPAGGTLAGTKTVTAVQGVASFDDLSIEKAAGGYTLTASGGGLASDPSVAFEILPAAATKLAFVTQPGAAEGQEPLDPTVEVEIQDEFGNRVTGSSTSVTVALDTDPTGGSATLSGTTTVSADSGLASFSDISLDLPADGYTLSATSVGLTASTSETFAVSLTFATTTVGYYHSCGVTVAGHAYCWGANGNGQLGDGTKTQRHSPVPVSGGLSFATVSLGTYHSCALTTGGDAYCWGNNGNGQLGDATTTERLTPTAVSGGPTFVTLSLGGGHSCGVSAGGTAYCWGYNPYGQLGDGTTIDRHTPVAVFGGPTFATVNAGLFHTCGVTTGDVAYCWGYNNLGQLGDGTTTDRNTPGIVVGGPPFATVSAGTFHSCAVSTNGAAFCWGRNNVGQLGDGTTIQRLTPAAVSGGLAFAAVSAGSSHTCGTTTGDTPYCWGSNSNGQLGDGTTTARHSPVAVLGAQAFASLSAGSPQGSAHTCGVTVGDTAYCWGLNVQGQLGDGTTAQRVTPVRVVQ